MPPGTPPHVPLPHRVPRVLPLALAAALAVLVTVGLAAPASAADGQIVNVERTDAGFEVSVDVPADVEVATSLVKVTVNGTQYDATAARIADGDSRVERTTVLAIDTSESMQGDRFQAARKAARTFLDAVPDDVQVGIVSFDSDVETLLDPTTDRDAARAVLGDLSLSRETLLYDGVAAAVELAGDTGQGNVLVLSDGADTSRTKLGDLVAGIAASGVVVDVVALERGGAKNAAALQRIAGQTGQVVNATSDDLAGVFSAEADVLARQIGVSVTVPADVAADQATIDVTLGSSSGDVTASTTVPAADPGAPVEAGAPRIEVPREASAGGAGADGLASSPWLVYAGVGVFGVGLVVALVMMAPAKPVAMSAEERITVYTQAVNEGRHADQPAPESDAPLKQASDAVAQFLERNQSLEARINGRLESAGSGLKAPEWLLLSAAILVGATVLGILLGGGSLGLGLVFLLLGAVGPSIYLRLKAARRRRKFETQIPETLQLMSGSLSAGLSLMQSVDTVVREGPEPVASEFRRVLIETRLGVTLEEALDGVADRFESQDFRWTVMAIRIQRQVGGNLGELLNTVADTMREREYIKRQVNALAAEGKLSAIVLGALPPLFLLYLFTTNRDYVMPLFTDPRGLVMLIGSALWLGVGIFWMSRLVKVEV